MWIAKFTDWLPDRLSPVAGVLLTVAVTVCAGASADDTEIFFATDNSQPNVLFIVDSKPH